MSYDKINRRKKPLQDAEAPARFVCEYMSAVGYWSVKDTYTGQIVDIGSLACIQDLVKQFNKLHAELQGIGAEFSIIRSDLL